MKLKFSEGSVIVYKSYEETRVKLTITQLNKLKPAAKNKTGKTLRKLRKTFKMKNCHMNYF